MSSDSLSHLQLVVNRLLSGELKQQRDGTDCSFSKCPNVSSNSDQDPLNLDLEAVRLTQLGSQLENDYKCGVTHRLEELENLQKSLANLFWHAQQQIEAYGAHDHESGCSSVKLTDVVEKLYNIKDWVEKMEDLMKDEPMKTLISSSDGFSKGETSSTYGN